MEPEVVKYHHHPLCLAFYPLFQALNLILHTYPARFETSYALLYAHTSPSSFLTMHLICTHSALVLLHKLCYQ